MRNARSTALCLEIVCGALVFVGAGCATNQQMADRHPRQQVELTSLLSRELFPVPDGVVRSKLEANLRIAERDLQDHPSSPELHVWVGRRWGYLWNVNKAIDLFTDAIGRHPDYAPLYRHRGHRYISARRFQEAIVDLQRAAELMQLLSDRIEPDGAPNDRNIPLTTTGFNVWYHLALAKYLTEDFQGAVDGFRNAQEFGRGYDDNLVATTDWIYMALRRLGNDGEAAAILEPIHADMEIIENDSYHRRLLMYKGIITPEQLLDLDSASELDLATLGYGLGNWYLCNGDDARAIEVFNRVVEGPYWPAFGFIAAEVDLARLNN